MILSWILLFVSQTLFIIVFGLHHLVLSKPLIDRPFYTHNEYLSLVPHISGLILAPIALSISIGFNYFLVLPINALLLFLFGPSITRTYIIRFASGKGFGYDMMYALVAGIVLLIVGAVIHYSA
jgi:hypothetical protein